MPIQMFYEDMCWLTVSDVQILIKSCFIESRNDPSSQNEMVHETKFSWKISYSTHVCLAQLDGHQAVMVTDQINYVSERQT